MANHHKITINGTSISVRSGELLLDAALRNGVDLPYDCRAGHCGTCCVRLISGTVTGGVGSEPGVVHACQCRIAGDATIESARQTTLRTVNGFVTSLLPLSPDVVEVGITIDATIPHHAGQYAQVRFNGCPSRPFSLTHPLRGRANSRSVWFHMRRMTDGRVTPLLGNKIRIGYRVRVTGPYGSAYFRPNAPGRIVLVATNTGFAPIWSIAVAALRENPERRMMIIAGGRKLESLYMAPAIAQLARFPNVIVAPVCSTPQNITNMVMHGRPTDFLPRLLPTDQLYACGAPGMVAAVKAIATQAGASCYADPFFTSVAESEDDVASRARRWLSDSRVTRGRPLLPTFGNADTFSRADERGG